MILLAFHLDIINTRFNTKVCNIATGTNCAPPVAVLFCFAMSRRESKRRLLFLKIKRAEIINLLK